MDQETVLLTNAFATNKIKLKEALNYAMPNPKNSEASEKVREEGNALYRQKSHSHELHREILSLYNKSITLAPINSSAFVLAIANRSALLLHLRKYKECIEDIKKLLTITKSNELKVKILCRQVECLKNLGDTTYENILDEAQSLVNGMEDNDKNKEMLQGMMNKVSVKAVEEAENSDETNEIVILPETQNMLEKVSINYNEKYGRQLVAEQNYQPGDIILVEKLFSTSVHYTHHYKNCHHCMKVCWLGVPCDHCDWALFCSEDCRKRAWKEYHDIECSVGQLLNHVLDFPWSTCSISIKILIKAMKDAGSIENLKAQLEAVDQCTDVCYKGFYKDGKFINNTVQSFYSLTKKQFDVRDEMEMVPQIAFVTVIGLLKHSQLMNTLQVEDVEDLTDNKDIVFLVSLLIKFTKIRYNNGFNLGDSENEQRAFRVASLMSLINHSCCPNANLIFTNDEKSILFALEPIRKSSQIFISYTNEYHRTSLEDREENLNRYNFKCDCQACTESWPAFYVMKLPLILEGTIAPDGTEWAFISNCRDVLTDVAQHRFGKSTIDKLAQKITLALQTLKHPSMFLCALQDGLTACIVNIYNGLKLPLLEKCYKSN